MAHVENRFETRSRARSLFNIDDTDGTAATFSVFGLAFVDSGRTNMQRSFRSISKRCILGVCTFNWFADRLVSITVVGAGAQIGLKMSAKTTDTLHGIGAMVAQRASRVSCLIVPFWHVRAQQEVKPPTPAAACLFFMPTRSDQDHHHHHNVDAHRDCVIDVRNLCAPRSAAVREANWAAKWRLLLMFADVHALMELHYRS